jgi:hypothetical protein
VNRFLCRLVVLIISQNDFSLVCAQSGELRRRIHFGLNKGEARNALARAVFFNRSRGLRDCTLENQKHLASGLNSGRGSNRTLEHGLLACNFLRIGK